MHYYRRLRPNPSSLKTLFWYVFAYKEQSLQHIGCKTHTRRGKPFSHTGTMLCTASLGDLGGTIEKLEIADLYIVSFLLRFEGGGGGKSGILNYTTLPSIAGIFSLKETYTWFDFLLAALDCYTWCFGERLLSPTQVFAGNINYV